MDHLNNIVYNSDIRFQKIFAILICFTIIFIPISILWLFSLRTPTDIVKGCVTDKRAITKTNFQVICMKNSLLGILFQQLIEKICYTILVALSIHLNKRSLLVH